MPRPPPRRVAVFTGSRSLGERHRRGVNAVLEKLMDEKAIILVGCATGLDAMVRQYLSRHAYTCRVFTADWDKYGNEAGPRRNTEMIDAAVELAIENDTRIECFAYPSSTSPGTRDTMRRARDAGATVYEHGAP